MLAQPLHDGSSRHGTGLAGALVATMQQHHRRDAADAEARGQCRFGLGIEFAQAHMRLQLRGCLGELRCHLPARAAPRCPEVDQRWQLRALRVGLECSGVERHRRADEQGVVAASTSRQLAQSRGWYPVDGIAVRAGDLQQVEGVGVHWCLARVGESWGDAGKYRARVVNPGCERNRRIAQKTVLSMQPMNAARASFYFWYYFPKPQAEEGVGAL